MRFHLQGPVNIAAPEHFDQGSKRTNPTLVYIIQGDFRLVGETFGQDINIDRRVNHPERILETAFRQAALQRHLTAFKAWPFAAAGTGVLTFIAFTGGATPTGTAAAADPFSGLAFLGERI